MVDLTGFLKFFKGGNMDLLLEFLVEIYFSLVEIVVPEHKFKKWQEVVLKIAGILVSIAILGCLIAGISFIADSGNLTVGITLTAVGGGLLAMQLTIFIVVLVHQIKAEKQAKKEANENIFGDGI